MSPSGLDQLEAALAAGQVVAVPTDTVYGLAVDPRSPGAVERLFALKKRPGHSQLPVLIADPTGLMDLAEPTATADRLISVYWPGPLTIVLVRRAAVSFDIGGDPSTIGLRCPSSPVLLELLGRTGPLAVTSANHHGEPPLHTAGQVRRSFGKGVAAVLDGGRCDGTPSTVISVRAAEVKCLREGAIPFSEIAELAAGTKP